MTIKSDLPPHNRRSLLEWLTEPSAAIQEVERRRRARLLSMLLLPLMLSLLIGAYFSWPSLSGWLQAGGLVALGAAYALSRTRYYIVAAILTVLALSAPSYGTMLVGDWTSADEVASILSWLALAIGLASLWFSASGTLVMGLIELGGILLLPYLFPELPFSYVVRSLGFLGIIVAVATIASALRQRDFQQIQNQVTELRGLNNALTKSNEEALAATRVAREASRLKSEFLATMSHELRTPLNAMIGFTEIMLGGMGGVLDEDARHMTQRIHANSKRLLDLINDVLDLSKIQAQKIEIDLQPFSPREFAESLHEQTSSLAQQKGLEFTVSVAPDLDTEILGDRALLTRVAANLLSNAFKFTDKGYVSLSLHRVGSDKWMFSVKDSGIGIPADAREIIFDQFRQIDGSSQRAYGGSGLGLAIVQQLVQALGGEIQVTSAVGKGSTFAICLPLMAPEAQSERQTDDQPR